MFGKQKRKARQEKIKDVTLFVWFDLFQYKRTELEMTLEGISLELV